MNPIILATIFAVLIQNVLGNSCTQGTSVDSLEGEWIAGEWNGFETTYRYCEPPPLDKGRCK